MIVITSEREMFYGHFSDIPTPRFFQLRWLKSVANRATTYIMEALRERGGGEIGMEGGTECRERRRARELLVHFTLGTGYAIGSQVFSMFKHTAVQKLKFRLTKLGGLDFNVRRPTSMCVLCASLSRLHHERPSKSRTTDQTAHASPLPSTPFLCLEHVQKSASYLCSRRRYDAS